MEGPDENQLVPAKGGILGPPMADVRAEVQPALWTKASRHHLGKGLEGGADPHGRTQGHQQMDWGGGGTLAAIMCGSIWPRQRMLLAESWIHPGLHGFRHEHAADDMRWCLSLQIEDALLEVSSMLGLLLDNFGKCFDRVPNGVSVGARVASRHGCRLVRPLASLYAL